MKVSTKIIFCLILILGIILRIWNFQSLFYYAIDEEKAAYIIRDIANLSHLPLAGHPSSIGFRLAPLFYYIVSPLFAIDPFPISIGILSVGVCLLSMTLLYKITKLISNRTALISTLLYGVSYLNVIYERRGWQLSFESFFILSLLWSLLKLNKGHKKYFFVLVLCLIAMTQLEVGLLTYFPFVIISLFMLRIKLSIKQVLVGILLVILSNSSLLLFDLKHDFLNSRYLLRMFIYDSSIPKAHPKPLSNERSVYLAYNLIPNTLTRIFIPSGKSDLAIQYANCPSYLLYKQQSNSKLWILGLLAVLILGIIKLIKNRASNKPKIILLKLSFLFLIIHFSFIVFYTYGFQGEMAEYYLIPTFIWIFIIFGIIFSDLNKRLNFFIIGILGYIVLLNVSYLFVSYNSYGLSEKINAVNFTINETGNKPFILDSFQTCWYTGGYQYLFSFEKHEPVSSYMDQYLDEYYKPQQKKVPKYKVTLLTPELIGSNPDGYEEFKKNTEKSSISYRKFGAIEVYIEKI